MNQLLTFLTTAYLTASAQAIRIDFSTGEGYSDGDLNAHDAWYSSTANVVLTTADGYNGAAGVVIIDPNSTENSIYRTGGSLTPAGESATLSALFQFTSTDTLVQSATLPIFSYFFFNESSGGDALEVSLRRIKNATDTYQIFVSGASDNHYPSGNFSGTLLGLTNGVGASDWIELSATLTRGETATDWSVNGTLVNLGTSTDVASAWNVTDLHSTVDFFSNTTYYAGFSSAKSDDLTLTENRRIDSFEVSYLESIPLVNAGPEFNTDSITGAAATADTVYTAFIGGYASDPESDPLTYSKGADAPDWLQITSDGTISGTPSSTDVGLNRFTIHVNADGGSDTAILNITVAKASPLTAWDQFKIDYNLEDALLADRDGQTDRYEFAHGGNPTNAASLAPMPSVLVTDGEIACFSCTEATHTNLGIPLVAEWTDNLVTGTWNSAWSEENKISDSAEGYSDVQRRLNVAGLDQVFCRSRIFPAALPRPNILVILCDDLGYCDVGFNADLFGEKETSTESPATPNIDSLANNGIICTQAYIPHPFCGPSRMGILAGRYPHQFGGSKNQPYEIKDLPSQEVRNNWGYEAANDLGIATNETTIATVLQDAGYHTGAWGKWHAGGGSHYHPNDRGFDYWYGHLGGGHNYYSDGWISKHDPNVKNDYQFYLTRQGEEVVPEAGEYITDMLTEDAAAFIAGSPADQPFFMYLCYNAPHAPLTGKCEDLITLFGGDGDNDQYTKQQKNIAMMYAVDRGVSNLVATLTAKGVLDDTFIIFFSDNGGKEMATENDADNGPLIGGKGDVFEGGVRTPMFIHYPNAIPAGSIYAHPVFPYDLYPTCARLGNASVPAEKILSGKDILDNLLADRNAHLDDPVIWVRHNASANDVAIRKGKYKAVRKNTGVWKLYDLTGSVTETNDIANANADILTT